MRPRPSRPTGYCRPGLLLLAALAQRRKTIVATMPSTRAADEDPGVGREERARHEEAAGIEEEAGAHLERIARLRQRRRGRRCTRTAAAAAAACCGSPRHRPSRPWRRSSSSTGARCRLMKPRIVARTMPIADDDQRVEQADDEGIAIGRAGGAERDQRLADVEAGRVVEEAEAGGDLGPLQVLDGVRRGHVEQEDDDDDEDDLVERCREPSDRREATFWAGDVWLTAVCTELTPRGLLVVRRRCRAHRTRRRHDGAIGYAKRAPGLLRTPVFGSA